MLESVSDTPQGRRQAGLQVVEYAGVPPAGDHGELRSWDWGLLWQGGVLKYLEVGMEEILLSGSDREFDFGFLFST